MDKFFTNNMTFLGPGEKLETFNMDKTMDLFGNKTLDNLTESSSMVTMEMTTDCLNEYCVSEEEYMDMIWNYIKPTILEYCLIFTYVVVLIVGLVGNFLVCFAVWRNHSMRTVTNYFIVNLAVADFLVILVCLPPTLLSDVTETWYMGSAMCKIVKYIQGASVCVSVLTLTAISIERWYAICHPLKFKATPRRAKYMISITWIISLVIILPELVVLDVHRHPNIRVELSILLSACAPKWPDTFQTAYQFFLSLTMYLLPFGLMFAAYFQIARSLWRTSIPSETSRDQLADTRPNEAVLNTRRKVAKMLMAVVIMFGICYLPVHLLNILRYTGMMHNVPEIATYIALGSHFLCYFNSAINPVIYSFMSAKFRKEFIIVCCCCGSTPCRRAKRNVYTSRQYIYKYRVQSQSNPSEQGQAVGRDGIHTPMGTHPRKASPLETERNIDAGAVNRKQCTLKAHVHSCPTVRTYKAASGGVFSIEKECRSDGAAVRLG